MSQLSLYLSNRPGPIQAIPTQPNGGNHSPAFADSARTTEAHKACMITTKALACIGFRVLEDEDFSKRVCVLPCCLISPLCSTLIRYEWPSRPACDAIHGGPCTDSDSEIGVAHNRMFPARSPFPEHCHSKVIINIIGSPRSDCINACMKCTITS